MSDQEASTPPSNPIKPAHGVGYVVIVAVFAILLTTTWIGSCNKKKAEEARAEKEAAAIYAAAHPAHVITTPTPVVKIGKELITHPFASNGCAVVWLEGNWVSYPQPLNAEIQFFDQHGRLVLEQGSKKKGASLYPGSYRICRAPGSNASGVQIWN